MWIRRLSQICYLSIYSILSGFLFLSKKKETELSNYWRLGSCGSKRLVVRIEYRYYMYMNRYYICIHIMYVYINKLYEKVKITH